MSAPPRTQLFSGLTVTSCGTLGSRVLGMLRDMVTAALFGVSSNGVMDAFVVAFQIPNLFRRLFGEGALAASYLPVLTQELEKSPSRGWQLATTMFAALSVLLAGVVLLGEAVFGLIWWWAGDQSAAGRLAGLSAVMLPYLLFICLAAQVAATLQALWHFRVPALAPAGLNICWLAAAWFVAPHFADHQSQAYVIAVAVLLAGVLQLGVQLPVLWRLGFRWNFDWTGSREPRQRIVRAMLPMILGLAVIQFNTILDRLLAWGLTAPVDGRQTIGWLADLVAYPFQQGAASALYFAERLYQFPLGMLGMAVATVIYPALSRHAARGAHANVGEDLTRGLRLVLFLSVPAGAGLILLAEPLAALFYQRGAVTAADTTRVARLIAAYGVGVWAMCASPLLVRGYYALGNQATPLRIALWSAAANVLSNLVLIWPLAEVGLALSTSLAAIFQFALLSVSFDRTASRLVWRDLIGTGLQTSLATAGMALAGYAALACCPGQAGLACSLCRVFVPLAVSMAVFFGVSRLAQAPELTLLRPGSAS
jgi:putative peptidoglycan lipid II flippase